MSNIKKLIPIIRYNKILEDLFESLATLEIADAVDTPEYRGKIEAIQLTKDIIDDNYRRLNLSDKELVDFQDELVALNHLDFENSDFTLEILNLKEHNKILKTINDLVTLSLTRRSYMYDYYQGLSLINEKILGNLDWNKRVTYLQQVEEEYIIRELESNIFAITTLLYIEEYIKNEHRKTYRNAAIKIKYRLIYIYPYLTSIFLEDKNLLAQADELKERIQRIDKLRKDMMFQEYLIPLTFTTQYELNQFKNFDSEYYSKRKNRFKAIMRAIYIKTCISINYDPKGLDILNKLRDDLLKSDIDETSKEEIAYSFETNAKLSMSKKID